MKEINFYCIEEDVNSFLFSLISKLIDTGKKIVIYSENQEKIEKLDSLLWTQKKTSFLPHLIDGERGSELTPIVLTNKKNNTNRANFLLISTFLYDKNFLSEFEKIFYIFSPINSLLLNEAKKSWDEYSKLDYSLKFLKRNSDGKWCEYKEFIQDNLL